MEGQEKNQNTTKIIHQHTILQCNIHEQTADGFERALTQDEANILLLQEISFEQRQIKAAREKRRGKQWQEVQQLDEKAPGKAYASIYVRSGIRITNTKKSEYICYAQIEGVGGIISYYNPWRNRTAGDYTPDQFADALREHISLAILDTPDNLGIIVAGDANCRHPLWSSHRRAENDDAMGEKMVEVIEDADLHCITKSDLGTYYHGSTTTTIDVAFTNAQLRHSKAIAMPRFLAAEKDKASNHQDRRYCHIPILLHCSYNEEWTTGQQAAEREIEEDFPYLPEAEIDDKELGKRLDSKLKEASNCEIRRNIGEIERLNVLLLASIREAALESAGMTGAEREMSQQPHDTQAGWDSLCNRRKSEATAVRHHLAKAIRAGPLAHQLKAMTPNERHKKVRMESRKLQLYKDSRSAFRRAQKAAARNYEASTAEAISDCSISGMWIMVHQLPGGKKSRNQCWILGLYKKGTIQIARTHEDMTTELMKALFPGFRPKDTSRKSVRSKRPVLKASSTEKDITETEVQMAIDSDPMNAPGLNKITAGLIVKCWRESDTFKKVLLKLYRLCFDLSYIPAEWRMARVPMLPKEGKDPGIANSYRPISLLSSISKIFERFRATRWHYIHANGGISEDSYGGVPGRSGEDAIAKGQQFALDARARGWKCAWTGIDVAGAFNKAGHQYLTSALIQSQERAAHIAGMQPKLLKSSIDWLHERSIRVTFNGQTSKEWTSTDARIGIPQGSPESTPLWQSYTDPLGREIRKRLPDRNRVLPLIFVDDLTVVVAGETWQKVADTVRVINDIIRQWAAPDQANVGLDKGYLLPVDFRHNEDDDFTPMDQVGISSDRPGCPTATVRKQKILGISIASLRRNSALDTIRGKHSSVIDTINSLRPTQNLAMCIKFTLARSLIQNSVEYGLWTLLPFNPVETKELEEMDLRMVCYMLGQSFKVAKKCNAYRTLLAAVGM